MKFPCFFPMDREIALETGFVGLRSPSGSPRKPAGFPTPQDSARFPELACDPSGGGACRAASRPTEASKAAVRSVSSTSTRDVALCLKCANSSHIDRLSAPVIFFQGAEDRVVPPNQTEHMVAALKERGVPVGYLLFDGEQHGFRKAENIKRALDAELYFYAMLILRSGLRF